MVRDLVQRSYAHYVARIGRRPGPMDDDYAAHVRDGHVFVNDRELNEPYVYKVGDETQPTEPTPGGESRWALRASSTVPERGEDSHALPVAR